MSTVVAQLDKSLDTALSEGHGTITIRVVVVAKALAAGSAPSSRDETPVDAAPDEVLPDTDKRPISTFLEEPKRGKQCCLPHQWSATTCMGQSVRRARLGAEVSQESHDSHRGLRWVEAGSNR